MRLYFVLILLLSSCIMEGGYEALRPDEFFISYGQLDTDFNSRGSGGGNSESGGSNDRNPFTLTGADSEAVFFGFSWNLGKYRDRKWELDNPRPVKFDLPPLLLAKLDRLLSSSSDKTEITVATTSQITTAPIVIKTGPAIPTTIQGDLVEGDKVSSVLETFGSQSIFTQVLIWILVLTALLLLFIYRNKVPGMSKLFTKDPIRRSDK